MTLSSAARPENPGAPEKPPPSGDAAVVRGALEVLAAISFNNGADLALAALARLEAERDAALDNFEGMTELHDAQFCAKLAAEAALAEATTALERLRAEMGGTA